MSLGVRIGQRQRITLAQGGVSPIYGMARGRAGMRPSLLNLQVIRNAGTSAHSVLIEGAGDLNGPWETLATITDQLILSYSTKIPDYIRATATTSTGGTLDFIISGAVRPKTTAAAGLATIALVRQATNTASGVASCVVTITAPNAGNALIAFIGYTSSASVTSVSGGGVTWVKAASDTGTTNEGCDIWYGLGSSGVGTSVTVTMPGVNTGIQVNVAEFSGVIASSALDQTNSTAAGISTAPLSNSITPAQNNELVVALLSAGASNTTAGPTNGFTALTQATNNGFVAPAYIVQTTAGAVTTGWTLAASTGWNVNVASFKAAVT